jgi:hypothetical protein
MTDIQTVVSTIGAGVIGIALIAVVLSSVFGLALDLTGGSAVLEPAPETATEVGGIDQPGNSLQVRATTGNALYLGGGGAYVDDPTNESVFESGSWTVAMIAEPSRDGAFGEEDTLTLYAAGNETVHLLYEQGNWTARYEAPSGQTAYVQAPASLDGRTTVGATYNASADELSLYVDGTLADSDAPDATTVPRNAAYSWIGSIDEVRVWNSTRSASQHAAYHDDPVQPLPANASARLMFNDGQPARAYYASGDATIYGETGLVDGVAGPDLVGGDDYETTTEPFTFRIVGGGYLDGAPVVFLGGAGGAFGGLLDQLISVGTTALGLLVVGLLVGAAVWVQDQFNAM